jgi:hypothetical protein
VLILKGLGFVQVFCFHTVLEVSVSVDSKEVTGLMPGQRIDAAKSTNASWKLAFAGLNIEVYGSYDTRTVTSCQEK